MAPGFFFSMTLKALFSRAADFAGVCVSRATLLIIFVRVANARPNENVVGYVAKMLRS